MTDVFASDRIIWVEGPTEELCFPYAFECATGNSLPKGISMLSVVATGDFFGKKRDKQLVLDIYQRLSRASSPLVEAVKFSFDSEDLAERDKVDMKRQSGGQISFLPRRHLECYFLNPRAIADFVNERDLEAGKVHSSGEVHDLLKSLASKAPFLNADWRGDISEENWLEHVDAANLIHECITLLTENRIFFSKKGDSLTLMRHIFSYGTNDLDSLFDYVKSITAW